MPETRKLPESSVSPGALRISSASPVTSASLTRHVPSTTTASAQTCSPVEKRTISSRTSEDTSTRFSRPSRTTAHCGAVNIFSASSAFLLRSSCTMPITALIMTTMTNERFKIDAFTATRHSASTRNTRLKYVRRFSRTICPVVRVGGSTGRLSQPAAARAAASASVSPSKGAASFTAISCRTASSSVFLRNSFKAPSPPPKKALCISIPFFRSFSIKTVLKLRKERLPSDDKSRRSFILSFYSMIMRRVRISVRRFRTRGE